MNKYKLAAMGGTFDHFHKGHQELLKHALIKAEKIIVGVTGKNLVANKDFAFNIESYEQRVRSVKEFVESLDRINDCEIVKLIDGFGPTLGEREVDSLVCSPLTEKGAKLINEKRQEKGLAILPIEVCELQIADDGKYISSTRIRKGEINRDGLVFKQLFEQDMVLSGKGRRFCKNPIGDLMENPEIDEIKNILNKNGFNMVVGDYSGNFFIENKIEARSIVFDGKNMRREYMTGLISLERLETNNQAGEITADLAKKVEQGFWESKNVKVEGEEDLAAIPAILLLPLGTKVFYGQPKRGMVVVEITEEKKRILTELIS